MLSIDASVTLLSPSLFTPTTQQNFSNPPPFLPLSSILMGLGERGLVAVVTGGGMVNAGVGIGGGGGVDDGSMQCTDHPFRANPGGICAFCLQEKLGKLVSSSKSSISFFPVQHSSSSNSSSPPSFRSTSTATHIPTTTSTSSRSRMSFLYSSSSHAQNGRKKRESKIVSKRVSKVGLSRSNTVAPSAFQPMDSPRRRWFWSFLYHHSNPNQNPNANVDQKVEERIVTPKRSVAVMVKEDERSPGSAASVGRKVSRSRSVGCGSRSFSGDFLERISTGLGDCALRRVESQREPARRQGGGLKIALHRASTSASEINDERIGQQRVRCGGIFSGFGMSTPSTTSISSVSVAASSYWLPEELGSGGSGRLPTINAGRRSTTNCSSTTPQLNARRRGWGWAFPSPMRAFRPSSSKPYSLTAGNVVTTTAPTTPGGRQLSSVKGRNAGGAPVSNLVAARG